MPVKRSLALVLATMVIPPEISRVPALGVHRSTSASKVTKICISIARSSRIMTSRGQISHAE